jgi:hypothetical protein
MKEAESKVAEHPLGFMTNTQGARDKDPDFIKAKTAFDEAKVMLWTIKNDTELKANIQVLSTVEKTLKAITDHLKEIKPEEKNKAVNIILAKTTADLSQFKADITGKEEDKKQAEVAIAAEKAIPRATVVAASTAWGFSLMSSAAASEIKDEIGGEIKKELGPWGMIFKWVDGVPTKDVAEQVKNLSKEYNEKKWTSDPFDKLMAMFQLMFLKFRIGKAGMDLSGDMTPEEMKLAGIKWGKWKEADKKEEKAPDKISDKYTKSSYIFQWLFLNEHQLPITDILDTNAIRDCNIQELSKVHTSKKHKEYLVKIWKTPSEPNIQALTKVLEVTFAGKSSMYILEAYNSTSNLPKKAPFPTDITFGTYITTASAVLKSMSWIAKAAATQNMQEPDITKNGDGSIKFNDNGEDENAALIDGDKKLLGFMLGTNATSKYTIGKREEFHKDLLTKPRFNALYQTPEEKAKATVTIDKILDFSDTFMKTIQINNDINLGMGNELQKVIQGKAFNLKWLMLIYLSMQGKNISNFNELSTIEQAKVYTIVTTIFNIPGNNIDNGKNTAKYLDNLNSSELNIPKWVKEFMLDSTKYIAEKSADGIWESIKYVTGMASESPRLALGFAAMNIPFVPARNSVADLLF